ncbi:putative TLC domain-containing protein C17A2.02c [Golovinomyces cichoracearum]|uniref:Putative TLC domain-containing protein C17A2.02c n=1 Tax=Golovinomyces cichoracearum TaxID=62708 RepID=A0A420IXZ3_9PEZI|nr:putative TLC domain-containing protein C17A2.02c [Golovinomyces cichoracearum]
MIDPFFPPIPALKAWVEPFCEFLHLRTLPLHIHEVFGAYLLYHTIFEYFSPTISGIVSSRYTKLSSEGKIRWNMHCVSFVQSVFISYLAIRTMLVDKERHEMTSQERIWGYTGAAGLVQATACGYFLFDLVSMMRFLKIFGLPMLAHAVSCLATYTIGFRPICNFYGSTFLIYELSTPFLNFHWFFDKLGMTGSKAQLYNGLALIGTFFCARLVWGTYATITIYKDVWETWQFRDVPLPSNTGEILRHNPERSFPLWLAFTYLAGHITLNALNVYWFNKMIEAVRKRFVKPPGKEI